VTEPSRSRPGPVRLLIGKVGLDGHDRGVKIIARALRDAGYEVIYTGLHLTPEQVSPPRSRRTSGDRPLHPIGAHMTLVPRSSSCSARRGRTGSPSSAGDHPQEDIPELRKIGVREIFTRARPPTRCRLRGREYGEAPSRRSGG